MWWLRWRAGQLTEKVAVILIPHSSRLRLERAHPDVLHMFLQVLDDGRLTDGQGRTVSFKDTHHHMTKMLGYQVKVEASVGFGAARENRTNSVLNQLGISSAPEFMNRFDGIIEFSALSRKISSLSWTPCLIMSTNAWLKRYPPQCNWES